MFNTKSKNVFYVGLMVFSMFFGAGNLIFPPMLGQLSGTELPVAMLGFLLSAVGLPVLALVVVAKAGGLYPLAQRAHPKFALLFTILIYLSIGPFLGIPRAASLSYEMGMAPFLNGTDFGGFALFGYTLLFFGSAFWLSVKPTKLVDRFGKVLSPLLILLIILVFLANWLNPIGSLGSAMGTYASRPLVQGFLDGYMTMDAIAALNFGIVISLVLRELGLKNDKQLVGSTLKAGLVAGFFLTLIYLTLAYLGAVGSTRFGMSSNGAQSLTQFVQHLFGPTGSVLVAAIFTLACLTTSVGLMTSCAQYFNRIMPKLSYLNWMLAITLVSLFFANFGLNRILQISVPVLIALYPMAIVLMVLALFHDFYKPSTYVYLLSIASTGFVSVLDALGSFGFKPQLLNYLPFYKHGLGWILPALIGIVFGLTLDLWLSHKTNTLVSE